MPKKKIETKETEESVLTSEVTNPEAKAPEAAKKIYAVVISVLVVIAFVAGWFALKTIFPKLVMAPTTAPIKREITPSEELPSIEIPEEKPIETFKDVDDALDELESGVEEIGELDPDLELPDINLDALGF